ncbi:hypothetical protein HAX54_046485 [Datura stramonium]|uniref:Uncharacterized protein n=1 Tax=Datura stramonium TaxID=4076 RepID=A0ABS8SS49_DATST|nr:hypothetical protein [Datura stramonium]
MDGAPNVDMKSDNQDLYSSTIPRGFDFDEGVDLLTICNFLQENSMNNNIIPSTSIENDSPKPHKKFENISELPSGILKEEQPMTTTNISSSSSTKKNSSRITFQITLDEDDDYSLSYIFSEGVKHISMLQEEGETRKINTSEGRNQENPKINNIFHMPISKEKQDVITNISSRREQENHRINDMIPVLEKLERESSMKSEFTFDHTLDILTSMWNEKNNPKANDPSMQRIPCLKRDLMKPTDHPSFWIEKENTRTNVMILNQESDFMKPNISTAHPYKTSTSWRLGEQENSETNDLIIQQSMPNISTLEKLESAFKKPKLMDGIGNEKLKYGIGGSSNKEDWIHNQILNFLDDEFPQKTSYKMLNGISGEPNSSQVDEIEKKINNNEETLIGGRSSIPVNHSNHNIKCSPFNTHGNTDKFKDTAYEQNVNHETQRYVYINQAVKLKSWNTEKENKDGAQDQL